MTLVLSPTGRILHRPRRCRSHKAKYGPRRLDRMRARFGLGPYTWTWMIDGIFAGVSHPDCSAPALTFQGVKTCREAKHPMLWCAKCEGTRP